MTARRLKITAEFWVMMLSRPEGWRVIKNRLPEDAKLVKILFDHDSIEVDLDTRVVSLWIASSAFLDTDPTDLPAPRIEAIP